MFAVSFLQLIFINLVIKCWKIIWKQRNTNKTWVSYLWWFIWPQLVCGLPCFYLFCVPLENWNCTPHNLLFQMGSIPICPLSPGNFVSRGSYSDSFSYLGQYHPGGHSHVLTFYHRLIVIPCLGAGGKGRPSARPAPSHVGCRVARSD